MEPMRRICAGLLALLMVLGAAPPGWTGSSSPPPPAEAPAPAEPEAQADAQEATPPRVSYIHGEVSFWRPGADDWAPAKVNTPLAPGDVLYTGADGNVEIQVGPRAFVRAGYGAQIGLDNQEPDFVQLRVTAGHAALDLRELAPGAHGGARHARRGLHRRARRLLPRGGQRTTPRRSATHRGGTATMTPAGGTATPVAANQQVVVTGTRVAARRDAAPPRS